eukprot:gene4774-6696_t
MSETDDEIRKLVCELCRQFFNAGWVTGTGGSISIRSGENIFMTPSGVQKERIQPDELFVVNKAGEIVSTPPQKSDRKPKLSDCAPLFLHAYVQRNAGAVLHSHSAVCNLITSMFDGKSEFRISHQEMIKGIDGYGYFDELVIPIIENTAWEHELADSLGEAIAKYPKACAVLVRRHGMYVWGNTWEQAKRHGECLHYLFEIAISMHKLGLKYPPDESSQVSSKRKFDGNHDGLTKVKKSSAPLYSNIIFDIEGTTTPITFVKDILFPYSTSHAKTYLISTWNESHTQKIVSELHNLAIEEKFPGITASTTDCESIVKYIESLVKSDRKVGPLKNLQGYIWEEGYKKGEVVGQLFDDFLPFLEEATNEGISVSIYSSGSRKAQQLLFKYSQHGDLTNHLTAYFDTKVGQKNSSESYVEILSTLGKSENPKKVLFVTDILAEAVAANEAGMSVVISKRPGNAPINDNHNFQVFENYSQLKIVS